MKYLGLTLDDKLTGGGAIVNSVVQKAYGRLKFMLNVDSRVKQLRLCHVHNFFNETGPSYLSEHFIKVSDVHHHFTRGSTENCEIPSVSGVAATTFYYSGIKDWNSLPLDVKQKCTFNGFKSAARQYLRI